MVACHTRNMGIAILGLFRCRFAIPGLQEGNHVVGELSPPTGAGSVILHVFLQRSVIARLRLRKVTWQKAIQRWNVGRALNGGMPTQGHNAATRPSHIAEEQLQNRAGANNLGTYCMVRPTDRVTECGGSLAA